MNGWVEAKLGDLFSFKNGMNAEKSAYGNGIPFVNVMDVFGTDVLTSDIVRGKIQASEKQIKEYLVKRGDVLFNRTSETFDEIALTTVYMDDAPIVFGGFVIRARPRTSKLDPNFCVYFFQADAIRREMIRRGQGAVRANIGQKDLATVPAAVPPLAEQKRIAEILSTWDRAIETTERLIANSEAQKKALMQQLLTGKKRLPGFSGKWSRKHFRDVVDIDRNSLGQNTPANFKFRYVSLSDVSIGKIATNLPEVEFASAPSRARRKLDEHDILMATVRPNLQAFARVSKNNVECIASTGFAVLTAKCGYNPSYIYHYLFSEHLTGQIDALVVGSSYPAINSTDIQGLGIICPEEQEQAAIARVLNAFDAPIAEYKNQLSSLCQEKAALMQQLLTGKRRVKIKGEAQAA